MLELCFIAPVMLLIAGATVDIGRYLRYQQISSTISQELANHVYRKCSDMTAFEAPQAGSTTVRVPDTTNRIQTCADNERKKAQLALQNTIPGAVLRVSVFRHNIDDIFTNTACSGGGKLNEVKSDPTSTELDSCKNPGRGNGNGPNGDDGAASGPSIQQVARSRLVDSNQSSGAIKVNVAAASSATQSAQAEIASAQSACKRNRLVVVEVGYQFQPIVSFLPKILPNFGPDKDGLHRETTIL
jgi:hypothetical protein